MKIEYECSFELWKEFQEGHLDTHPTTTPGIWTVIEKVSGDFGYVFVDETENFYPKIFKTVDAAVEGRSYYCLTELANLG